MDRLLAEATEASRRSAWPWASRSRPSPPSNGDDFDFKFQPSLDAKLVRELATGRFIAGAENGWFFGPPGVGKPTSPWRLAAPPARLAAPSCSSPPHPLLATLSQAPQEGKLADQISYYAKPKRLIIDSC